MEESAVSHQRIEPNMWVRVDGPHDNRGKVGWTSSRVENPPGRRDCILVKFVGEDDGPFVWNTSWLHPWIPRVDEWVRVPIGAAAGEASTVGRVIEAPTVHDDGQVTVPVQVKPHTNVSDVRTVPGEACTPVPAPDLARPYGDAFQLGDRVSTYNGYTGTVVEPFLLDGRIHVEHDPEWASQTCGQMHWTYGPDQLTRIDDGPQDDPVVDDVWVPQRGDWVRHHDGDVGQVVKAPREGSEVVTWSTRDTDARTTSWSSHRSLLHPWAPEPGDLVEHPWVGRGTVWSVHDGGTIFVFQHTPAQMARRHLDEVTPAARTYDGDGQGQHVIGDRVITRNYDEVNGGTVLDRRPGEYLVHFDSEDEYEWPRWVDADTISEHRVRQEPAMLVSEFSRICTCGSTARRVRIGGCTQDLWHTPVDTHPEAAREFVVGVDPASADGPGTAVIGERHPDGSVTIIDEQRERLRKAFLGGPRRSRLLENGLDDIRDRIMAEIETTTPALDDVAVIPVTLPTHLMRQIAAAENPLQAYSRARAGVLKHLVPAIRRWVDDHPEPEPEPPSVTRQAFDVIDTWASGHSPLGAHVGADEIDQLIDMFETAGLLAPQEGTPE